MKSLLLMSFFIGSAFANELLPAGKMEYWHKLLHYRGNFVGGLTSEVDDPRFFIHQDGKTSPVKELMANIEVLNAPNGQEYVCRFPLRYKWLKKEINNDWNWDLDKCHVYKSFISKLDVENISLVFSSYYINNPGSTFGHTFLRLGRYEDFKSNELLDYAVNFAAHETKDNPLVYMVKGLVGSYPGRFSVIPYYYKVREYSDNEFRDIWDYDLNLNSVQIDQVVDHIWELGSVHFDYFYFTENCSYHILGLLNVAYEDIDLLKGLNPAYVLPIDTVKEMKDLGLISDRKVRISAYGKLLAESSQLSAANKELVKKIANEPEMVGPLTETLNTKTAANVLDASISAIDYFKADKILKNEEKATDERRLLLLARAENPEISPTFNHEALNPEPPDESHGSSRVGLSYGHQSQAGHFFNFEWRAAQHGLLDPPQGQLKTSQVVLGDIKIRYQETFKQERSLVLEKLRFIDLKKYQPSTFWSDSISWDLAIGLVQRDYCHSHNCLSPDLSFGVGNTTAIVKDIYLTFLMGGKYQWDKDFQNDSLLNLGPKVNFLVQKKRFSLGVDGAYFFPSHNLYEWLRRQLVYEAEARFYFHKDLGLFIKNYNSDFAGKVLHETQLGLYLYY